MPLRYYRHKETQEIKRSLKSLGDTYEEVIVAPNGKFMVCANPATGKSKLKDMKKILTERARNHSRDVDLDDTIAINRDNNLGVSQNLLNKDGLRRKKIDDI